MVSFSQLLTMLNGRNDSPKTLLFWCLPNSCLWTLSKWIEWRVHAERTLIRLNIPIMTTNVVASQTPNWSEMKSAQQHSWSYEYLLHKKIEFFEIFDFDEFVLGSHDSTNFNILAMCLGSTISTDEGFINFDR